MNRRCIKCGVKIDKCMGFVLARDFVNGRKLPRELCGKCVLITKLDELEEGGFMDEVKVTKADLLEKLKENRDKHIEIYEDAMMGYRAAVVEKLEEALKAAKGGGELIIHIVLPEPKPEDHTKDYDIAIGMLGMCIDPTIAIDFVQYRTYILDEWNWSKSFSSSSSNYSSSSSSSS